MHLLDGFLRILVPGCTSSEDFPKETVLGGPQCKNYHKKTWGVPGARGFTLTKTCQDCPGWRKDSQKGTCRRVHLPDVRAGGVQRPCLGGWVPAPPSFDLSRVSCAVVASEPLAQPGPRHPKNRKNKKPVKTNKKQKMSSNR